MDADLHSALLRLPERLLLLQVSSAFYKLSVFVLYVVLEARKLEEVVGKWGFIVATE